MTEGFQTKGTVDDVVRRLPLAEGAVVSRRRKRKFSSALIFLLLFLSSCPGSHHQTEKKTAKEGDQVDQLWLVRFSRFDLRRERGGRGGSDDDGRRQRIDKELLQQDWHSGEEALEDGRLKEVIVEVVEDPASGEGHRGEEVVQVGYSGRVGHRRKEGN